MAAAAITPRPSETAFMPASLPGVSFTTSILSREREQLHRRGRRRLLHDFVDRQPLLRAFDIAAPRLGRGMAWREQGAAVLVGDDRDRVGAQPDRFSGDLLLVHADQRSQ